MSWVVALPLDEVKESAWSPAIVVEHVEVGEETSRGLHDTDLEISEGDELGVNKMITLGVSWETLHDVELRVLVSEGNGRDHISAEIDTEDKHS